MFNAISYLPLAGLRTVCNALVPRCNTGKVG